jgi:hypothetical protein
MATKTSTTTVGGGGGNDDDNNDELSRVQSSLFELLGEGESSVEALHGIMARMGEIRDSNVTEMDLTKIAEPSLSSITAHYPTRRLRGGDDVVEGDLDRLRRMRDNAHDASDLIADLRLEMRALGTTSTPMSGGGVTMSDAVSEEEVLEFLLPPQPHTPSRKGATKMPRNRSSAR